MAEITTLLDIMAKLRDPNGGCPWDVEQNFATIAPYTIEEAYEVAEAITKGDRTELRDELGDLLLQVVFHAQMAKEEGSFEFADVVEAISEKMIRRHPHVFADATVKTADAQVANWENIKEQERRAKPSTSASGVGKGEEVRTLSNIPSALPALMRAQKLQARAARVGFDWPEVSGVIAKIREELLEVEQALLAEDYDAIGDELGDLLFAVTNLARFTDHDAETSLRGTNEKFTRRFGYVEDGLKAQGKNVADATLNEMGALWDEAKRKERA